MWFPPKSTSPTSRAAEVAAAKFRLGDEFGVPPEVDLPRPLAEPIFESTFAMPDSVHSLSSLREDPNLKLCFGEDA